MVTLKLQVNSKENGEKRKSIFLALILIQRLVGYGLIENNLYYLEKKSVQNVFKNG